MPKRKCKSNQFQTATASTGSAERVKGRKPEEGRNDVDNAMESSERASGAKPEEGTNDVSRNETTNEASGETFDKQELTESQKRHVLKMRMQLALILVNSRPCKFCRSKVHHSMHCNRLATALEVMGTHVARKCRAMRSQNQVKEDAAYDAVSEIFRGALETESVLPCTFCRSSRHTASKCKNLDVGIHAYNIIKERRDRSRMNGNGDQPGSTTLDLASSLNHRYMLCTVCNHYGHRKPHCPLKKGHSSDHSSQEHEASPIFGNRTASSSPNVRGTKRKLLSNSTVSNLNEEGEERQEDEFAGVDNANTSNLENERALETEMCPKFLRRDASREISENITRMETSVPYETNLMNQQGFEQGNQDDSTETHTRVIENGSNFEPALLHSVNEVTADVGSSSIVEPLEASGQENLHAHISGQSAEPERAIDDEAVMCDICHRWTERLENYGLGESECFQTDLKIRHLTETGFTRRNFGDMSKLNTSQFKACHLCRKYVTARVPKFNTAWPSVFWSYMKNRRHAPHVVRKILRLLTPSMFVQWIRSSTSMSNTARSVFDRQQVVSTIDRTFDLLAFTKMKRNPQKFMTEGFWERLISDYPFEDVRCPAGCHCFIDDDDLRLVSLKHYIAKIDKDFNSFEAKASTFTGARPDWPSPAKTMFGVEACPSIIRNESDGLSFMVCCRSRHPMEKTRFVHVPLNPCLTKPINEPCTHAPIRLSASIVRKEQMHRYNCSFRVIRQFGNASGLSTVTLSKKTDAWIPLTEETLNAASTAIFHRPGIRSHVENICGSEEIGHFIDNYQQLTAQNPDLIEKCRESGTYIDVHDAIHETYAHVTSGRRHAGLTDEMGQEPSVQSRRNRVRDVNVFVRTCLAEEGMDDKISFPHPMFPYESVGTNTKGIKTHLAASVLANCRSLHRNFIQGGLWTEVRVPQNHRIVIGKIQGMIQKALQNTKVMKVKRNADNEICEANFQMSGGNIPVAINYDVAKFLELYSNNRLKWTESIPESSELNEMEWSKYDNIVCSGKTLSSRCYRRAPIEILGGTFALVFAANINRNNSNDYSCRYMTRWNQKEPWIRCVDGKLTNCQESFSRDWVPEIYNFLIYENVHSKRSIEEYKNFNWTGGQDLAYCELHNGIPLIREPYNPSDWACCSWPGCSLHGLFRCSENNHCRRVQCTTSVCRKHFKEIQESNEKVFLKPTTSTNQSIPSAQHEDHDDFEEDIIAISDVDSVSDEEDMEERNFVDSFSHVEEGQIRMTECQSRDTEPVFISSAEGNRVRSSYILNNMYQVMGRFGISRRSPLALQRLLQGIYASNSQSETSTLFLEGELFPWIFPFESDGSVIGALPHSFFMNPLSQKRNKGVATMMDHMKIRIRDGSLLTACEPDYISWAFDVVMNYIVNYNTVDMSLRKGPEFLLRKTNDDGLHVGQRETGIMFDAIESRGPVNELAALVRDQGKWDYFVTLTCNDRFTPGVSSLFRHVNDYAKACSSDKKVQMQIMTAGMPSVLRAWYRYVQYFWMWVTDGPDQPLGKVKSIWYRYEFQDAGAPGNKPHVHAGVTLDERYPETELEKAARVTAHDQIFTSPFQGHELRDCLEKNIVTSVQEYIDLREFIRQVQTHNCAMANYRCMKRRDENGHLVCRVGRQKLRIAPEFEPAKNVYDHQSLQKLHVLGLAEEILDPYEITPDSELVGGKYGYQSPGGLILPTVASIAWSCRASTNVQKCDRKFLMAYLLKYNAGKDEKAQIRFFARPDSDVVRTQSLGFRNIKITSQRMLAEKEDARLQPLAREIGMPEMLFVLSDLQYVHSSVQFVHVPTFPPEHRMAVRKIPKKTKRISSDGRLHVAVLRGSLPESQEWRQFTNSQMLMIKDYEEGVHYPDTTTAFSLRPPELLIFNKLGDYSKWFTSLPQDEPKVITSEFLDESPFTDGAGRRVKIRAAHIPDAVEYLRSILLDMNGGNEKKEIASTLLDSIFEPLLRMYNSWDKKTKFPPSRISKRFVCEKDTRRAVPVFSSVSPSNATKFLVHLLLSMGEFNTEWDLYNVRSLKESFCKAKLISNSSGQDLEAEVIKLIRRYVTEQLMWLPITNRTFCRYLNLSYDVIRKFFLEDTLHYDQPPLLFIRDIQQSYSEEVERVMKDRRSILASTLEALEIDGFPGSDVLINQEQNIHFRPHFSASNGLSAESILEQEEIYKKLSKKIDDLERDDLSFVPGSIVIGPPGSGKTHLLNLLMVYALTRNKNIMVTAMGAERARELGGIHLHTLLGMNVAGSKSTTATQEAEKAIKHLVSDPINVATLRALDILFIDEIGFISKELLSVLDIVLRRVRCTTIPYGGVLILGSGDYCQLPPVSGDLVWRSTDFLTVLEPVLLHHLVRSAEDINLQRIIELLRKPVISEEECEEIIAIIETEMTGNFSPDFSALPGTYLKVFSKKCAVREENENSIRTFKAAVENVNRNITPSHADYVDSAEFVAIDQIATTAGSWDLPDNATRQLISRRVREEERLFVFRGAIMRFTKNDKHSGLCQGQLLRVTKILRDSVNQMPCAVSVQILPRGMRDWTRVDENDQRYIKRISPSNCIEVVVGKGYKKARRKQLPLVHCGATTIHKALGQTCEYLATRISDEKSDYGIWSREQLLVILSRVRRLANLQFIGTKTETLNAMRQAMKLAPRGWDCIEKFLSERTKVTSQEDGLQNVISWSANIEMCSLNFDLPGDGVGAVYCLASEKHPFVFYIGQTNNLTRRLAEHNSPGGGSKETHKAYLKPWVVAGYAVGFHGDTDDEINKKERLQMETEIHWKIGRLTTRLQRSMTSYSVRELILGMIRSKKGIFGEVPLVWKDMATLSITGPSINLR